MSGAQHQQDVSPAVAKARLLTLLLTQAARAKVSTTAHAVLAHLIADSWPVQSGWQARTPITTIANRLGVSYDTVARAVRELELAEVLRRQVGGGTTPSCYVLATGDGGRRSESVESAPVRTPHQCGDSAPMRGEPPRACGGSPRTGADPPSAPVRTLPDQTDRSSSISSSAHAAAVEQLIAKRPEWLPEGRPWIELATVRRLAALPTSTPDVAVWALRLTRENRNTLTNPAGYLISRLNNPDLEAVRLLVEQRRRAQEIARQRGLA